MRLLTNVVDLWVFSHTEQGTRYLLLEASQGKADRYFGGHTFWQIPGTFVEDDDEPVAASLNRALTEFSLEAMSVWAVEHVYTIFNRRFDALQIIPTFAAEVDGLPVPSLDPSEFGQHKWVEADEVRTLLTFRMLLEGFDQLVHYITGNEAPRGEFRLS